jgi:hypothetical protein
MSRPEVSGRSACPEADSPLSEIQMPAVDYKTPENAALMRNFRSRGLNCEFGESQRQGGFESTRKGQASSKAMRC